jgi:hypothetical protein
MSVPREFKHLSTGKHLGLYLATQLGYRAGKFDSRWLRSQNGHEESFFTKMARWCIRAFVFAFSCFKSTMHVHLAGVVLSARS